MFAMVLQAPNTPLVGLERSLPEPAAGQVRIKVLACGVCRTDLHVYDGELPDPKLPLILGHEIVGTVDAVGSDVELLTVGERVGVPWLGHTCGHCYYCLHGQENLCENAIFTGYTRDGGYAEYAVADARFCFRIPPGYEDSHAAPLLCAGLIGWRSFKMTGDAINIGMYGFGAAAHIIAQVASHLGRRVFAFTRTGDLSGQEFARSLGAVWAGSSAETPPEALDAAIIFAPVGSLVPAALRAVRRGGTVVCAGIHMSDIPSFPYEILWEERVLRSVANLTREDGVQFMEVIAKAPVKTIITPYKLADAQNALSDLRQGRLNGAAVLLPTI